MHDVMRNILVEGSNLLPDFNDDLLLNFRKRKIRHIKDYLNELFMESIKLFNDRVKYLGWVALSPDERIDYIKSNVILKNQIKIQKSTFELIRFIFEFEGIKHYLHVYVPFLEQGAVWLDDTRYYPLFPIVERGGLHRTQRDVIIKVMRAPLIFKRSETFTFGTDKGAQYKETIVTVKIHQRRRGRGSKSADRTPLILYHLVKYPFDQVMAMYGFNKGDITITDNYEPSEEYSYIKIKNDIFLKVKDIALGSTYNRRVIASYLTCLMEYPRFDLRELMALHPVYYTTVLGKYTYPNATNATLLYENAIKHLETTDTLLDPPAQYQLAQIGIKVKNIYELLLCVFFNIDNWIVGYDPTDLYEKKIGALDQIMAPLVSTINSKLFQIINSKNEGLTQETINRFVTSASQHESWLTGNVVFRANPTMCNDNWLLAIGSKRFRSLNNMEQKGKQRGSGKNMPTALLKAHPSHLMVESILALPPSSPIVSGEINPYCIINENGDIIPDEALKEKIAHVYD